MIQFSPDFCSENRLFVHAETDAKVIVAGTGDELPGAADRISKALARCRPDKKVEFIRLPVPELMLRISALEPAPVPARSGMEAVPTDSCEIRTISAGAPAVTVLNSLLLEAKYGSVSDIHLERNRQGTEIRFRTDGVLRTARSFDSGTGKALAIRIKLLANLNTLEIRKPQDGRFGITAGGTEHDIRVSIVPTVDGESIVLRFLDTGDAEIRLQDLSFPTPLRSFLEHTARLPQGLVLVTGPTGSGKTTTLAALIRECRTGERKIISIEDPVEYRIPGLTQIQTNEALGLGFGVLLRRILRQDPDIIMIGEIRDGETAELAVRAALTGHLVFSTLHTRSANESVARLVELGIPKETLRMVLHAVIGQRLFRKTCKRCAGNGCMDCSGTGYAGRIPAAELYMQEGTVPAGCRTSLAESAGALVAAGLTDRKEIERVLGDYNE